MHPPTYSTYLKQSQVLTGGTRVKLDVTLQHIETGF